MPKVPVCSPRSPPNSADIDASLIQASLLGNPASFSELVRRHQPSISLMVHRHLRQREETEDVVQGVFIKAYQHLIDFRGESKFSTWLYSIALNLIRNHVRQRNMRRMDSLDATNKNEEGSDRQWPDNAPLPEKIAQDNWDIDQVRLALNKLIEPYCSIFALHYFQHLSLKEIAFRHGRPLGTVKVYLHRARKMVLEQYVTLGGVEWSQQA